MTFDGHILPGVLLSGPGDAPALFRWEMTKGTTRYMIGSKQGSKMKIVILDGLGAAAEAALVAANTAALLKGTPVNLINSL
jgi:hypothetical protein